LTLLPEPAIRVQTDALRETVDKVSRMHRQVLTMVGSAQVKIGDKLSPVMDVEGTKKNITVLDAKQQHPEVPKLLAQFKNDLETALTAAPQANSETRAAAHRLLGQVLVVAGDYHSHSARNAAGEAGRAMAKIDRGMSSVRELLVNIKQIAPVAEGEETGAGKMKTTAQTAITKLKGDLQAKKASIVELETKRDEQLGASTKYTNEASEMRTLASAALGKKRSDLQEKSFAKDKLANQSALAAEDFQREIDQADIAVAQMGVQLTSAESALVAADALLTALDKKRNDAKTKLDAEVEAMNDVGKQIVKAAGELTAACEKISGAQKSAAQQYIAAGKAVRAFQADSQGTDAAEAISAEGDVLKKRAASLLEIAPTWDSAEAFVGRLKGLWEAASLEGQTPLASLKAKFAGKPATDVQVTEDSKIDVDRKVVDDANAAVETLLLASAKRYRAAAEVADPGLKWSFQCRELAVRSQRLRIAGAGTDRSRAEGLRDELKQLEGFPYVDEVLKAFEAQ